MNDRAKPNNERRDFQPKFFWFERLPSGEKVICFSKRSRGVKHEKKMTFEQFKREYDKA